MSNLKYLRSRIKSIKSTQKITKVMQMVSASKLRKIREEIVSSVAYTNILDNLVKELLGSDASGELARDQQIFLGNLEQKNYLLILMSSNKGLCGSFNSSLIRRMREDIINLEKTGKNIKIIVVGKKGHDVIANQYASYIVGNIDDEKIPIKNQSSLLQAMIMDKLLSGEVDACCFYYGRFKNALMQLPSAKQIIPIDTASISNNASDSNANTTSDIELEGTTLFSNAMNMYLAGYTYYCLLQSRASEEGARMTAMENATKNANDLIDRLTLKLNRTRQATITKELTEIISGAESI